MRKTEKSKTLGRLGNGMGSRPSTADSGRMNMPPGGQPRSWLAILIPIYILPKSSKFKISVSFWKLSQLGAFCNAELELPEEHLGGTTCLSTTLPISTHGVSRTMSPAPVAYLRSQLRDFRFDPSLLLLLAHLGYSVLLTFSLPFLLRLLVALFIILLPRVLSDSLVCLLVHLF